MWDSLGPECENVDGGISGGSPVCANLERSTSVDEKMSDWLLYVVLRHLAKKMSWKEFGLLKACNEVLENYDEWLK